jgi:hypothetical protein
MSSSRDAPERGGGPATLPSLPASIAGPGRDHSLPPPPPPLPRETLQPHSASYQPDMTPIPIGDEDSPLMLSAEQLSMYEGLFDDVDFLSNVRRPPAAAPLLPRWFYWPPIVATACCHRLPPLGAARCRR